MPLRYLLLGALLLPLAPAAAQPVPPPARGGGPGSDVGVALAYGTDGRYAVVGDFEQTATFGAHAVTSADAPAARSDVFVVMYAADGTALWVRRMGTGVFNDFAGGVAVTPGGMVVVSGYFTGIATWDGGANPDISLTTRNDFDAFVAAYTDTGDLLWVQQIGGPQQDTGRGVAVDELANVYATGSFTGSAIFGDARRDTTLVSAGSSDGYLAKYRPDGSLVWARRFGGTDGDDARAVALGREAAPGAGQPIYVGGTFRGVALFGAVPLQSRGASDLYAVRVSSDGVVEWAQQVGGSGFDYARGIAVGPFVGDPVLLAGSFEDSILLGTTILTSAGNSDAVVARIHPATGVLLDGVRIGGGGFDIANGVATDGGYAWGAVGYVEGPFTVTDPSGTSAPIPGAGGVDAFVYVAGSIGGPDSQVLVLGGTDADRGYGVAGYGNYALAFTGSFRGTAQFDGMPLVSAGSNDVFTFALQSGCGVCPSTEPGPEGALALGVPAPNPATGRTTLTLTLDRPRAVRVEVIDALGRRVALLQDGPLAAGPHVLAVEAGALAPGVYVVRAEGEGVRAVRRLAVGR